MKILDIILESTSNVVIIGDSIAVGMGGSEPYAKGGINCIETLRRVKEFVASGKAKGATVILSSGASNSVPYELEGGVKKPGNGGLGAVPQQLKALKDAGATVVLIGTGSKKSKAFPGTSFTGGKKYVVDLTGVNEQLEAMANAAGVKFLGPLEDFDPAMHSGNGDGIHPYNGYSKLKQAGSAVAPQQGNAQKVAPARAGGTIEVPQGRVGPAVADIQKVLLALGYKLPKHGVDGVRGPETAGVVRQFQKDNALEVDGDPGVETVAALNKLIASKGIKFTNSTQADVKGKFASATDPQDVGDIMNDNDPSVLEGRKSAENYLGRKMSDEEWTALMKVTAAEEADTRAMAWVMAAILNRTNRGTWGNSVVSVVSAPSQFEPVTGPKGNEKRLHTLPIPGGRKLKAILTGAKEILPSVPKKIVNFTSNIDAAYKGRSSISYKHKLLARGGEVVGNSVFAA
jgi:peptidoglycan hydrolase-like protein with peptidoglycan-binding domain